MAETTKVESSKVYTAEDWLKEYEGLCKKGFSVVVVPTWVARDDNSFSMVLKYTVGETPKQK